MVKRDKEQERRQKPQPKQSKAISKPSISKFVKKTSAQAKKTQGEKHFKFEGFFERLKAIDVKLQNASLNEANYMFDNLLAKAEEEGEDDLSSSNFIQLLKSEKFNNKTPEFGRIFRDLESLSYSYPLVIMNRQQIVKKLVGYLTNYSVKVARCTVLELITALIKDMRKDIFGDFLHLILPKCVGILDIDDLKLLDKVFQLLSLALKYLLKEIKADIENVYSVYFELLRHSNKYVRKFASQSLSYVIRKLPIDDKLADMLLTPVNDQEQNAVYGMSDLLYEVIAGSAEDLHSKAREMLAVTLKRASDQIVRVLYLKLVNSIDTQKQLPLFESLTEHLTERRLLQFKITTDCVQLKFGRRISQLAVIHLVQSFSHLTTEDDLDTQTRIKLAECLGYLYYFKHAQVIQIFQKSKLDFKSTKSVFSDGIYRLAATKDTLPVLQGFFSLLVQKHENVKPNSDIDILKVLGLKESRQIVEFSEASHSDKAAMLIPSFGKHLFKTLIPAVMEDSYSLLALFLRLVNISKVPFIVESLPSTAEKVLISALEEKNEFKLFTAAQFAARLRKDSKLTTTVSNCLASEQNILPVELSDSFIKDHFVLERYQINKEELFASIHTLLDLNNFPFHEQLILSAAFTIKPVFRPEHAGNLYFLRCILAKGEIKGALDNNLAKALSQNLSKNNRELRILTLEVLRRYQTLTFKEADMTEQKDKDLDTILTYYTGECNVLDLLYHAEASEIGIETEKNKANTLRKVLVMVGSGLLPDLYQEVVFHFAVGCLWVKFAPLFPPAMELIQELFRHHSNLISQFLLLFEHVGLLCQIAPDNDTLIRKLLASTNLTIVEGTDPQSILYEDSRRSTPDFVQVKDFHYNLTKTLYPVIDIVLSDVALKGQLFSGYESFINSEYFPLHHYQHSSNVKSESLSVIMTEANRVDSDDFKQLRKTAYSKLCAFYELLSKASALGRLSSKQTTTLSSHLHTLINSQDEHFQKLALQVLLKLSKKSETSKYTRYARLLEGLVDDKQYKDMIPIIVHGSTGRADDEETNAGEESKKKEKGKIPKLEPEDRMDVLPLIIKILFSKMLKRRGAINKKSIKTRKNLVYQFLAGLDPATEFQLFFAELLQPLGLTLATDPSEYERKLASVSFGKLLAFLDSLEVIFKQLGRLITDYLDRLTHLFVKVLVLAKHFLGHLRVSAEEGPEDNQGPSGSPVYKYVERQCRTVVRRGFKLIRKLYTKFPSNDRFLGEMTRMVYEDLIADELQHLSSRYISERSLLIEVLCLSWSEHAPLAFLQFDDVLPKVMGMLTQKVNPTVFASHVQLVRNVVSHSLDGPHAETARSILTKFSGVIANNLHAMWSGHQAALQAALLGRRRDNKPKSQEMIRQHIVYATAVKDLVFILAELSSYLGEDIAIAHGFLEILVGLVGTRVFLKGKYPSATHEQTLIFGVTAINQLIAKVVKIEDGLLARIFEIFLDMQSKKGREKLAEGLDPVIDPQTVQLTQDLNRVKRGVADIDFDFDSVLGAIERTTSLTLDKPLDTMLLTYNMVYLVQTHEFSVRDYATHAFSKLVKRADQRTFVRCEKQLSDYLRTTSDELILKSLLQAQRNLVIASQELEYGPRMISHGMVTLLNPSSELDDFFSQVLSLQLKTRQKALRKLSKNEEVSTDAMREVILPLIDYIIFASHKQMQNQRHTVRYNREQAQQLREEALNIYVGYCGRLTPFEYFRLLRKLLFKLRVALSRSSEQHQTLEKVRIKCICKVLDGFPIKQVPDALQLIEQKIATQKQTGKVNEFTKLIAQLVGHAEEVKEEVEEIEAPIDGSDSEEEPEPEAEAKALAEAKDAAEPQAEEQKMVIPIVPDERELKFVAEIQERLRQQVLPVLQRHLTEPGENKYIRSFVAVSVAKVIRRLPIPVFNVHLHKLINLIVSGGLRSRDINSREKARKALVKVVEEVSPRFLTLIFTQMQDILSRGYQLHVHIYTIHYILQALNVNKQIENDTFIKVKQEACLQPGQITSQMIQLTSDLLLRELFGDLLEEKLLEDTNKKHIKESKARKSMAIFEVFAQYIDFRTSFLDLIAPVVKILEGNPNLSKIQQCEELLGRISTSILKNKTIDGAQLLVFLYSLIERGVTLARKTKINDSKAHRDYGANPEAEFIAISERKMKENVLGIEMKWKKSSAEARDKKTDEVCGRVLAHFGLQTLKKALKIKGLILMGTETNQDLRAKLSIKADQELIERLDPFVPVLLDAFSTYYNPIVVSTLNILLSVVHLGLPSFSTLLKKFLNRILKLFEQTSADDPDFTNSLFRVTSELIRTYSVYNDLSESQVRALVLIIKTNLASFQTQQNVFHCLRAIIYRKFMCADLYDLMESVQELMVSSVQKSTRTICAQIFIQFLLEYPLEAGRLEQHINHVVKNLGYFEVDGRLQLLEVMDVLVTKLPKQLLDSYADLFFFALFLRLVNDSNNQCREKVTSVMCKLLRKTSKARLLLQTVMKVDKSDDEQKQEALLNGKLQVLAVFGQTGTLARDHIKETSELCCQIIEKSANQYRLRQAEKDDAEEVKDEDENPEALRFLNAIDLVSDEEEEPSQDPWSTTYFASLCLENLFKQGKHVDLLTVVIQTQKVIPSLTFLGAKHENYWVRLSTQRLFSHILTVTSAPDMAGDGDLTKLIYTITGCFRYPYLSEELATVLEKNLATLSSQVEDGEELAKIFKKSSYVGRKVLAVTGCGPIALKAILNWYKTVMERLKESSTLRNVTRPMLELVYRTYTDQSLAGSEVNALSTEIVDTLSTAFTDKHFFIQEYNEVQQSIVRTRQERKMKQKIVAATPEGAEIKIRRRKVKAQKAKEKRKDKILRYQMSK